MPTPSGGETPIGCPVIRSGGWKRGADPDPLDWNEDRGSDRVKIKDPSFLNWAA